MESAAESGGAAMTTDLVVVFMDIITNMVSSVPLETGEEVRFVRVKPDAFDLTHVVHGKFYSTNRWHTRLLAQLIDQGHIVLVKETAVVQNFKHLRFWVEIGIRKESVEMVSTTLFRVVHIRVSLRINFKREYENDVLRKVFEKWKTSKQFAMECDKADAGVGLSPPADVIKLELYDHQKQGLRWMIDREEWPDSDDGSELPPFWEEKDGLYKADLSFLVTLKHPQMIRGGILADESGMGKTLTLLSLIAYTKHSRTNSAAAAACTSHVKKKQKIKKDVNFEWRPTLVVCPPSILATWKEQIGKCTWPGSLKVSTYHGKSKTRDANLLSQHDIVLTTYNIVVREEESDSGILNKIDWWRVVLDDVHVLKSVNSRSTTPCFNLKANRRWAVTGKPLKEDYTNYSLYPSMSFLHVHPYCHKLDWERFLDASPLERTPSPPVPLLRFEVLMGIFSLRRKMPRFIQNYMVVLSKDEQDLYDSLEAKAKKVSRGETRRSSEAAVLQLWQSCNSLAPCRLSCAEMISSNNNFQDLRGKPKLLKKWVNLLQEENDYYCPICLDQPDDAVITRCAHMFCKSCIMHLIEKYKFSKSFRCPMCRRPLEKCHIFESSIPEKMKPGSSSANISSSKVSALITMLRKSTNSKSVVLSQFRRTLELVDGMLSEAGFEVRRIDTNDNVQTKAKIVKEFSNAESSSSGVVLVSSFKTFSNTPGLDLSAASNVYLMEPCWNAHTEEEALGRIHRLGIGKKEENVNIIRLVCKKSIEEKALEIRKMKPAYGSSNYRREVFMNDNQIDWLLGFETIRAC